MNSFLHYQTLERLAFYMQTSELNGTIPAILPGSTMHQLS